MAQKRFLHCLHYRQYGGKKLQSMCRRRMIEKEWITFWLTCFDSQAVELLRRSAATATLVIERYRQPEPEGPQLEDLEDLLRTSVRLLVHLNMGRFLLEIRTLKLLIKCFLKEQDMLKDEVTHEIVINNLKKLILQSFVPAI